MSWSGKSPGAEETRGSISRWGIRRSLIIQTGRFRMNFSQRLTPLATAKYCIKSHTLGQTVGKSSATSNEKLRHIHFLFRKAVEVSLIDLKTLTVSLNSLTS